VGDGLKESSDPGDDKLGSLGPFCSAFGEVHSREEFDPSAFHPLQWLLAGQGRGSGPWCVPSA
jgi:hypothetical protein